VTSFLRYTALRLLLLVGILVILYAVGVRGVLLPALAIVLSLPLSYVVLAKQRTAFANEIDRKVADRRERKADLRARLAGNEPDDD
jgi:hypothetical protein